MTGFVNARGESAVPEGITDLSAGADLVIVDKEVEAKLLALAAELESSTIKAKYKLELTFGDDRSMRRPIPGFITAWTNGGFMHGGGDEAVYFCPNEIDEGSGNKHYCGSPIDLKLVGRYVAVCPSCRRPINPKELAGQVFFRLTIDGWAEMLTKVFHRLECNADLRVQHLKGDLRRATQEEMEKDHRGDRLNKVREGFSAVAYPLKNILKDTAAGSTIQARFRAFLLA